MTFDPYGYSDPSEAAQERGAEGRFEGPSFPASPPPWPDALPPLPSPLQGPAGGPLAGLQNQVASVLG